MNRKIFILIGCFLASLTAVYPQQTTDLVIRSKFFFDNNMTNKALQTINKLTNKDAYAFKLEGQIQSALNNHSAAIVAFKKANALKEHYADFELSKSYAKLNRYDSTSYYLELHLKSPYKSMSNVIEQSPALEAYRTTDDWKTLWRKDFYTEEEKSIERAIYYKNKGELDLALDMLDEVLSKNKNNTQALYYRAQFIIPLNQDYKYAISDLKKAVKLAPDNQHYVRLLASYYLHELKFKKALEAYLKAHTIFPYLLSDWFHLSQSYYRTSNFDNATKYINKFISIDAKNIEAYKLAGLIFYDNEKYQEAVDILTQAIYINSRRADILLARGKALLDSGDYQRAGQDFGIALDLDSKNGEIWYYKGLAFLYQDKTSEACKYFTKASFHQYYRADEYLLKECSD